MEATLKVLQINLHHSKAASAAFCRTASAQNIDIALIQEPWLVKGRVAGLNEAKGELIYCRTIQNVRTCILVRNRTQCLPCIEFCSRDITAVKVRNNVRGRTSGDVILCSAYLPYDAVQLPPTRELASLVEQRIVSGGHLLVGCDANAHSVEWGSTDTNRRGESLLEFLLSNNLHILNLGNKPTFRNRIREEVIDITFCSEGLLSSVDGWRVSDEPSLSDHSYILFNLGGLAEQIQQFRNPRKTQWATYADSLSLRLGKIPRITSCIQLEQAASNLQDIMLDSYCSSCPLLTRSKNKNASWWTRDLAIKRGAVRRLFKRARRTRVWGPRLSCGCRSPISVSME